jgi:hypothetical protein
MYNSHHALCGLAELALASGEPVHALTLISVAMSLMEETGVQPTAPVRTRIERVRATAAQALSPEEQTAAWAAGQTLPLEQVIAEALRNAGTEQL